MADAFQTPTSTIQQQVGFAPQLAPYGEGVLGGAAAAVATPYESYADWAAKRGLSGDQVAQFTDLQKQAFTGVQGLGQDPYSKDSAAGLASLAAQAGNTKYNANAFNYQQANAPSLQNYQMQGPAVVQGNNVNAQNINAAQMGPAQQVGTQSFTGQGTANEYMNPYMQNVVDIQKREAQRQSGIQGTQQAGQATSSGALGGSRDAIMRAERERNLGMQMGDIQAQGSNAAFQQAQQQFNAEQQARLAAQQSNQQAGLTTGMQNLNAQQQTNVQNAANQLQASGMNAQQAMQAALANQQAGLTTGQQNLAANLQTQQLGSGQNMQAQLANQQAGLTTQQAAEQSKQFGSNLGLQGTQMGLQGYAALGSQGQNLYGQTTGNIGLQGQYGGQQQQQVQNMLNVGQQNYAAEQNYPYKQIGFMSDIVRGAPMSGLGSTMYQAQPSMLNQVAGLATAGAGAYGAYNKATGNAKGGAIKDKKPAGLQALMLSKMA